MNIKRTAIIEKKKQTHIIICICCEEMDASVCFLVLLKTNVAEKTKSELFQRMHIKEFHKPDCPQIQSPPSPLSAHQLPEINMLILISTLIFYIKQSFLFVTFYMYICFASHLPVTQAVPFHPALPFLLWLQVPLYPLFLLLNPERRVVHYQVKT